METRSGLYIGLLSEMHDMSRDEKAGKQHTDHLARKLEIFKKPDACSPDLLLISGWAVSTKE